MGLLSLFKNLNLGFGIPHMPTTTSAGTMEAKEYKEVEHDNKMPLVGDHHENTGVDKDTRIGSDKIGSSTFRMDLKFNDLSMEEEKKMPSTSHVDENVEGKLEKAVLGQRRLAKFKGDQGVGQIASSENVGQIECKLNFMGLPIRPGEKKCPFFMRTGSCKFASRCRFHHPDPTAVVGNSFQECKNGLPSHHHVPVEQLCEEPRPSEKTSNEQKAVFGPFTSNRELQQNVHWNEIQTTTSPLHPREMNINDQRITLASKHITYAFSGGVELQQFEEYPQRPSEPECQYFMKTGYCKFKSFCRYHHPKSNVRFLGLPQGPVSNNHQHHGTVEQLRETPLPSVNASNEQTAFLSPSSSYVSDLFTPNQGIKPNAQWNEQQTVTNLLHPSEIKKIDQQQALADKDAADEISGGEPQQFDEYPQRPSEPECRYFMKTGYCKFKSACRYHHPKLNLSSVSLPLRPASNNYEKHYPVEQLCDIPLPSENSSNDQTAFLCPSSSNVLELFTTNQGLQPNVQCNGDQMATSPLHPPEMKIKEKGQELANNDTAYEFNCGVKSQQFDEYPQRPGEPECQYFMKTGYCKFKSTCRCHHPKSNFSFPAQPLKPMDTSPFHPPEIKMNEKGQQLANKETAYEFNGGLKSLQVDEYPQRPGEPECQYFMKTGYCKFKSACRGHHPKSNISFPAPPLKPDKPFCTHYRRGICKFGSACRYNHHMEHTDSAIG